MKHEYKLSQGTEPLPLVRQGAKRPFEASFAGSAGEDARALTEHASWARKVRYGRIPQALRGIPYAVRRELLFREASGFPVLRNKLSPGIAGFAAKPLQVLPGTADLRHEFLTRASLLHRTEAIATGL